MKNCILIIVLLFAVKKEVKAQPVQNLKIVTADNLKQDFTILKNVLLTYHPGLYRFQDSQAVAKNFNALEQQLQQDLSLSEAYLLFSRFTASILCGHTYCNYYNQGGATKESLFNKNDKVPFTFTLFNNRMFIEKNVSEDEALTKGTEVLEINFVPVSKIIDTLIQYIKGDGNNNGKRLNDLHLSGIGKFESFDIFFPLLFPPVNNSCTVKFKAPGATGTSTINVKTVSRSERFALIEKKFGKLPSSLDDLWEFKLLNNETGYLRLGTFVTDKLTINWKKFLKDAFDGLNEKNIQHLIIDIRGNEGGDDEVNLVLGKMLAKKRLQFPAFRELLRYEKVAEEYRPYLNTWDQGFYDRSGKVIKQENGFYTWKKERGDPVIRQNPNAFKGNTYLLTDAANSSATFFLAAGLQQNNIATLVGSQTGGNLKGTNGGQLFFLRLPNSTIEVDVPLIGYYPLTEQPNKGIDPDIMVQPEMSDILLNKDKVLEKALELITKN